MCHETVTPRSKPRIVPKGARPLERFNANIVALYARGLSTRDIGLELKTHVRRGCVAGVGVQGHRRDPRKELTDWVEPAP